MMSAVTMGPQAAPNPGPAEQAQAAAPSVARLAPAADVVARRLPSGRSLVLRVDGAGEEIEIRSGRGEVEVRITLTDAGPVVALRGARLELEAPDVAVRCKTFDVHATEALSLSSDRDVRIEADELRVKTEHDVHLNGAFIRLNCTADCPPPEEIYAQMQALAAAASAQASCAEHPVAPSGAEPDLHRSGG